MLELAPARVASEEYRSCSTPPHGTTLAMQADSFGWGALWAALGAIFGTIVAGFFAWLTQRSKGEADKNVAVIGEWSKLTAALSERITEVEKELASVRSSHAAEIEAIRKAHSTEIDEMRKAHRAEMRTMRNHNDGLERMIAQNAQSTAQIMGKAPPSGSLSAAFPVEDEGEK
jgi:Mg2+ and Co2+ transporter CorA